MIGTAVDYAFIFYEMCEEEKESSTRTREGSSEFCQDTDIFSLDRADPMLARVPLYRDLSNFLRIPFPHQAAFSDSRVPLHRSCYTQ